MLAYNELEYKMSPSGDTKKSHNSPRWRVVAGGGVVVGHPSTNHNTHVWLFFVARDFSVQNRLGLVVQVV